MERVSSTCIISRSTSISRRRAALATLLRQRRRTSALFQPADPAPSSRTRLLIAQFDVGLRDSATKETCVSARSSVDHHRIRRCSFDLRSTLPPNRSTSHEASKPACTSRLERATTRQSPAAARRTERAHIRLAHLGKQPDNACANFRQRIRSLLLQLRTRFPQPRLARSLHRDYAQARRR